ncbi:T9SS-dependent M36 family metallopeptidase [Flavobacterium sp.]|uniref:T9SS-dependent M36 family metallopeptidase n=1 Tax=Flavobacterium sp. TaxID=239 RepID=UPI003750BB96
MKKHLYLIFLLLPLLSNSQTATEKIQMYLNDNYQKWQLTKNDVSDWFVESEANSKSTAINNYYIKQRYQGIEIFGAVSTISIKNNEVIAVGNRFLAQLNLKINTIKPVISAIDGLMLAKANLAITNNQKNTIVEQIKDNNFIISNDNFKPIKAKLVFQKVNNNLRLAWDYKIDVPYQNHYWSVRIDAINGIVLEKKDLVISCTFDNLNTNSNTKNFFFNPIFNTKQPSSIVNVQSGSYRVLPYYTESPNHGSRQLISSPSDATASPFGWHDVDGFPGEEFTITQGNNVYAFEDTNDIESGASPDGGATLVFDFPYAGNTVSATNYLEAATTNLFYMNNIIHDVFYNYGFDEFNGNFQSNNYTNTGDGNDYVVAQSQDGGGINNANFSTPSDGENGRMQMYLWNRKALANLITLNSPSTISGNYAALDNNFTAGHVNLPILPSTLTSNLVLFNDGSSDTSDACEPPINAAQLNGKIVVIRRGTCTAASKVKKAQNAGAIAVIIVNNVANNYYISGSDNSITIPTISVSKAIGESIITEMAFNTVNASLGMTTSNFVNSDGDFDNLVITHEYGHGISNRLTGGRLNSDCLFNAEQMGEGWSDWFGLMMQIKLGDTGTDRKGVGTFVSNQPINDVGIRSYPYSTDMTINPFTFGMTNQQVAPHGVGSVWATMLWDLTWAYIDKYGFDSNIYTGNGGNNKVIQIVIDGLKLQPCSPSFVEGRDAIIAADQAITGGQDFCMIWEVFARRGLGFNATSGDNDDATDQTEDFTTPSPGINCTLGIDYFQNDNLLKVYPNPSNGLINIKINNYQGKLTIQVIDINGRMVDEYKNENFNIEKSIDLKNLQSGMYIIKITGDNLNFTQKIIKTN